MSPLCLLRGHVARGAHDPAGFREVIRCRPQRLGTSEARQAKIEDLDLPTRAQKNVCRFQITVNDAVCVCCSQPLGNRGPNFQNARQR